MSKPIQVALIGNPNTGKTSIFNELTGLNQKVGNYPGITVDKKQGAFYINKNTKVQLLDLPGTYSLNTTSLDESVAKEVLLNKNNPDYPDVAVVVVDVENLKRNLLLFTQIKDLGIPTILAINMADRMSRTGIELDIVALEKALDTKIALVSARKGTGIQELKNLIGNYKDLSSKPATQVSNIDPTYFEKLNQAFPKENLYKLWVVITEEFQNPRLEKKLIQSAESFNTKSLTALKKMQHRETVLRYKFINDCLKKALQIKPDQAKGLTATLDRILTHKIFGYLIFATILLIIFQVIYDWSGIPMDFIDAQFAAWSEWLKTILPAGTLTDLITDGIVAGIGGVVIFIPQIAFLFLFISILEESGYMSRVVFLMDRIMRPFGLSGKSVVPLISGTACAIPAVMAARNIDSWKERLIAILVVPFTTCSARLPVYLIIIALVIPEGSWFGISFQALSLMGLYLLGFAAALGAAWLLKLFFKSPNRQFFLIELPNYKTPLPKNVGLTVWEKTKSFVLGAGKIILAISIVIWFLAAHGPGDQFNKAEEIVSTTHGKNLNEEDLQQQIAAHQLRHSYIGILGSSIEPVIRPLGYDWKIGIALITSFAAREVFVGTLATIYSVSDEDQDTIKNRMEADLRPDNGKPLFDLPTGVSLLLFYAFAMQCMSTLAIVKRETNGWKWPVYQFIAMTTIAYVAALVAYQILK
ncbi:MAG: ferrous iron transport protein B [Flavobacteriaceae bacterium]|nr:ferrous iron transport protein B [Flavobacteriaceae bacterium]